MRDFGLYLRRNKTLVAGLLLLSLIVLFVVVGSLVTDPEDGRPLAYRPSQPPSAEHWLGTDRLGKDILAVMVEGTPQTIRIGLIAPGQLPRKRWLHSSGWLIQQPETGVVAESR